MTYFIRLQSIPGLSDGLYNTSIIRKLSCNDESCHGSVLIMSESNEQGVPHSVTPGNFDIYRKDNPGTHSSLKALYDYSPKFVERASWDSGRGPIGQQNSFNEADDKPISRVADMMRVGVGLCAGIGIGWVMSKK